ncbi:hypothetical protein [Microbispora sp. CA-102843]
MARAYREPERAVEADATFCHFTWKARKEYWSTFAPTMSAVLESLSPPA